jgi:hypothetical protein
VFFLAGLLLACAAASMTGDSCFSEKDIDSQSSELCESFGLAGDSRISRFVPLSIAVFSYALGFLGYIIHQYKLATTYSGSSTIFFFSALIAAESKWQMDNRCVPTFGILLAILVPSFVGAMYSYIIDALHLVQLQYFNGLSTRDACTLGGKRTFKCTKKRSSL